jgi:hypothetical protein
MVLTKEELIASLKHEVHILVHLARKLEPRMLDYRPGPKQRSAIELLQYMALMGPQIIKNVRAGGFDQGAWRAGAAALETASFEKVMAILERQGDEYVELLGDLSADDLRAEIEMFGRKGSRGSIIVNMVLCGHAAYRTQLFLYLKACGREELSTMNLWAGADAPAPA